MPAVIEEFSCVSLSQNMVNAIEDKFYRVFGNVTYMPRKEPYRTGAVPQTRRITYIPFCAFALTRSGIEIDITCF